MNIQPIFYKLEDGQTPKFPLPFIDPPSETQYYVQCKSKIQKSVETDYALIPMFFTKEELDKDIPKFIILLESEAIPYDKNRKFKSGWESYRKGNKRYYYESEALVSPFRDEKYGLGYLGQFEVEILKEKE